MTTTTTEEIVLPGSITLSVNGANLLAPAKPSASGNVWYEARQEGSLSDPEANRQEILSSISVSFEGQALAPVASGVHQSAPRKNKDGSVRTGTGGNWTVTHMGQINLGIVYIAKVTATIVDRKTEAGTVPTVVVVVTAYKKGTPKARTFKPLGSLTGSLTF